MALTVGAVARQAEVNVQTVRYYERVGLIPEPGRTAAGYRQYAEDTVRRIRFIKRAQELGFSLREIGELLDLRIDHDTACHAVEEKTRDKIALVDEKIEELRAIRETLNRVVAACRANEPTGECPMLEMLEEG